MTNQSVAELPEHTPWYLDETDLACVRNARNEAVLIDCGKDTGTRVVNAVNSHAALTAEVERLRVAYEKTRAVAEWILESPEGFDLVSCSGDPRLDAVYHESGGDDIAVNAFEDLADVLAAVGETKGGE